MRGTDSSGLLVVFLRKNPGLQREAQDFSDKDMSPLTWSLSQGQNGHAPRLSLRVVQALGWAS